MTNIPETAKPLPTALSKAYRVAGFAVVLFCGVFFVRYLVQHWSDIPDQLIGPSSLLMILAMALFYQISFASSACACGLLLQEGRTRPAFVTMLYPLLISQFAKYLPGNVAHHIGRIAMLKTAGFRMGRISIALLIEIVGAILAAVCVVLIYVAVTGDLMHLDLVPASPRAGGIVFGAVTIFFGVLCFVAIRTGTIQRARTGDTLANLPPIGNIVASLALYMTNFVVWGIILFGLASIMAGQNQPGFGFLTAMFALAWIAGLVTPGAPGGLGVREAVIVAMTGPVYGADAALFLSVGTRIVSTLGDLVALLIGLAIRSHLKN